jgi:aconitate decarboxylase
MAISSKTESTSPTTTKSAAYNAEGGITSQLCTWIGALTLDDVPEPVRTRAKYLFLDGIACALVGARVPWSAKAFEALSSFEEPGRHVVIGFEQVR